MSNVVLCSLDDPEHLVVLTLPEGHSIRVRGVAVMWDVSEIAPDLVLGGLHQRAEGIPQLASLLGEQVELAQVGVFHDSEWGPELITPAQMLALQPALYIHLPSRAASTLDWFELLGLMASGMSEQLTAETARAVIEAEAPGFLARDESGAFLSAMPPARHKGRLHGGPVPDEPLEENPDADDADDADDAGDRSWLGALAARKVAPDLAEDTTPSPPQAPEIPSADAPEALPDELLSTPSQELDESATDESATDESAADAVPEDENADLPDEVPSPASSSNESTPDDVSETAHVSDETASEPAPETERTLGENTPEPDLEPDAALEAEADEDEDEFDLDELELGESGDGLDLAGVDLGEVRLDRLGLDELERDEEEDSRWG